MTIVFGWNSYRLKSISLAELGIIKSDQPDINIDYRQKYFHLFWIPMFPIGRIWTVRKDGKDYHVSPEIEQVLENSRSAGKQWIWAWTGPLLGLIVWIFISMSNKMEQRAYANRAEKNTTELSAFFKDPKNTTALNQKLKLMNGMIDSVDGKIKYETKAIDTSHSNLLRLYIEALSTQTDTLLGYDEKNTFVVSIFKGKDHQAVPGNEYAEALQTGVWKSSDYPSSVYKQFDVLKEYKYILVLKEYNRVEPKEMYKSFASGYSFVKGVILSIETGKEVKSFKMIAANSDKIQQFRGGNMSSTLKYDLERNVVKDANKYVFNFPHVGPQVTSMSN